MKCGWQAADACGDNGEAAAGLRARRHRQRVALEAAWLCSRNQDSGGTGGSTSSRHRRGGSGSREAGQERRTQGETEEQGRLRGGSGDGVKEMGGGGGGGAFL